jgi:hypothetical protein
VKGKASRPLQWKVSLSYREEEPLPSVRDFPSLSSARTLNAKDQSTTKYFIFKVSKHTFRYSLAHLIIGSGA